MLKFYERILNTVGLNVIDNEVYIKKNDVDIPITRDHGLRIALPDKDKIKNELYVEKDGEFIPTFKLFNPLKENALQDGLGLNILREHGIEQLNITFAGYGYLLLLLLGEPELQADLPMEINNFVTSVRDKNVKGMKKSSNNIVDETMLKNWRKIISESIKDPDNILFNIVIRNPKVMGTSVTRECLITSDVYNKLKSFTIGEDNIKYLDITLRPKDIVTYVAIFKTLFGEEESSIVYQTENTEAPGFIVLMKGYLSNMNRMKEVIELLKDADSTIAENLVNINVDMTEIENSPLTYRKDILLIPSENEINKTKTNNNLLKEAKTTQEIQKYTKNEPFDPVIEAYDKTVQQQNAILASRYGVVPIQNMGYNSVIPPVTQYTQPNQIVPATVPVYGTSNYSAYSTYTQPTVQTTSPIVNTAVTPSGYNLFNNSYYNGYIR